MKKFNRLLWGCFLIFPFASSSISYAGQTIYQMKDTNGSTLLTNRQGSYGHLKVEKKTYYADSNIHTYNNWGPTEASVLPSQSRNKNAFDHIIRQAAQRHGVPEGLIKAVMHTESGFNVNARSPVGAQGLMQLMPATAQRFKAYNAYDPYQNIMAGTEYLAWLLKRFNGNLSLVLAGYNAGEGNVKKYGGIPPFRETQDYVRRVNSRYKNLYAQGVSSSASTPTLTASQSQNTTQKHSQYGQVIASSTQSSNTPRVSSRDIIMLADGSFTDAPRGSYATNHASASARIALSD